MADDLPTDDNIVDKLLEELDIPVVFTLPEWDFESIPVTEEEEAAFDRWCEENPITFTPEEERRNSEDIRTLIDWCHYYWFMKDAGISYLDFWEWCNLAEKPKLPGEIP